MKKLMVSGLCLAGLIFISSCNSESSNETDPLKDTATTVETADTAMTMQTVETEADSIFAKKAAEGGMMEVQLAQYAIKNATSAGVKKHAQMMVSDHGKANTELKTLAASKNITLPTVLGEDKQKKVNDLKAKKGAEFDKAYSDFMVEDHKADIDLFKKQADNGKDAEIKSWAAGKLPTLQSHLQMWESVKEGTEHGSDTAHKKH